MLTHMYVIIFLGEWDIGHAKSPTNPITQTVKLDRSMNKFGEPNKY